MAGKMRVSALAKELGIPSKELLARLTQLGEYVKSPSSTIEAPLVRRLCDIYGVPAPRQPAPRPEVPEDPQAAEKRKEDQRARLRQVSAQFLLDHPGTPSRAHQPITAEAVNAARFFGVSPASIKGRRDARTRREPNVAPVDAWTRELFSSEVRERWESVGVSDPMTAHACMAENITPKTLAMVIDGRTLGSRLRDGDSLGSIIGLIQLHRSGDGAASA